MSSQISTVDPKVFYAENTTTAERGDSLQNVSDVAVLGYNNCCNKIIL